MNTPTPSLNHWGILWRTFLVVHVAFSLVADDVMFFVYLWYVALVPVAVLHVTVSFPFIQRRYTLPYALLAGVVGLGILLALVAGVTLLNDPQEVVRIGPLESIPADTTTTKPGGEGLVTTDTVIIGLRCLAVAWTVSLPHYFFYWRAVKRMNLSPTGTSTETPNGRGPDKSPF